MAQFPPLELTLKGETMMIRSSTGKAQDQLIITKAKLGDGVLGDTTLRQLTDIIASKLVVPITSIDIQESKAIATFVYDNKTLTTGFYHREVGIFAKNGESGEEYLLAYSNAGNFTSYIPDKSEPIPSQTLVVAFGVSHSHNVTLSIDDKGIITPKDLERHNTSDRSHRDIRERIRTHSEQRILDHPDSSVTTEKLKDRAVTGNKIAMHSITKDHLATSASKGTYVAITVDDKGLVTNGSNTVSQQVAFASAVTFSGVTSAITPSEGDSTTKVATTSFVTRAISNIQSSIAGDVKRAMDGATAIEVRDYE